MDGTADDADRRAVAAPALAEVAAAWWDRDVVPVVTWDAAGTTFELRDGDDRIRLLRLDEPAAHPAAVAEVLSTALAACDFPPTADGPEHALVLRTLATNGVQVEG